jgi:hypothetical protein
VGGVIIAGGVGSLINHSFSSIIIGVYEVMYVNRSHAKLQLTRLLSSTTHVISISSHYTLFLAPTSRAVFLSSELATTVPEQSSSSSRFKHRPRSTKRSSRNMPASCTLSSGAVSVSLSVPLRDNPAHASLPPSRCPYAEVSVWSLSVDS